MLKTLINQRLQQIANSLLLNSNNIENIGLLNGKTGIALFLYHYANYTKNDIYSKYADELIDEICKEVTENTSINYNYIDGLAGFGTGIEYMVKKGFIEADTNEVFEDVDNQIYNYANLDFIKSTDLNLGVCGIVKYFSARLTNFNNERTDITNLNKKNLEFIVDKLEKPYNTYLQLLSVIHVLSDNSLLNINARKAKAYLDYAIDKLETMVNEDFHFRKYPGTFNPLSTALTLIQASEKLDKNEYSVRALYFLNKYETDFRQYLDTDSNDLVSGSIKWSLLYNYIGRKLQNKIYIQISEDWLNKALAEDNESSMGILKGNAGIGLALLTLIDECSTDWFDLIPFYVESEKKSNIKFYH